MYKKLQENKNLGLTGPINNNPRILTQTFVSRIHYDLFDYYFPEEIINWCCDDWINDVYKNINAFSPLLNHLCVNIGGDPRYFINNDTTYNLNMRNNTILLREQCSKLVERDVLRIYIKFMNLSYTILNSAIPVLKKDYGSINNKINIFCQFFIHPIKERYNYKNLSLSHFRNTKL